MNKKIKTILIAIFIILGIAALGTGIFLLVKSSSGKTDRELLSSSLKFDTGNLFEKSELSIDDLDFKLSTDTSVTVSGETASIVGDLYYKAQEAYGKVKINSLATKETMTLQAVLKDFKLYHKVDEKYSKFYYVDLKEYAESFDELLSSNADMNITDDQIETLNNVVKYFFDSIDESIKDEDIKTTEEVITLGGKEIKTKKISVEFTQKDLLNIAKRFTNKIKDDKDVNSLIEEIAKEVNIDYNELINNLDELISQADDKENVLVYSINVDGDDVVSTVISIDIDSEESPISFKITLNNYENSNGYDSYEAYLTVSGVKLLTFKLDGISKTKYNLSLDMVSMIKVEGTCEVKDDSNFSLNMTVSASDAVMGGDSITMKELLTLNLEMKETKADEEYEFNFDITSKYDEIDISISSKNTMVVGGIDIPQVDLSGSADISKMTDKEKEVLFSSSSSAMDLLS